MAEPDTKRAPSDYARATAAGARKKGTAITPANAAKLLAAAVKLPKDTAGRMVGSAALCAEHGLGSPDYITRCLLPSVEALGDEDVPFERKEHCNKGVPVKLTPRKDEAMREKALEWGFDFSFEDMAVGLMELFEGFTISAQAIAETLTTCALPTGTWAPHLEDQAQGRRLQLPEARPEKACVLSRFVSACAGHRKCLLVTTGRVSSCGV